VTVEINRLAPVRPRYLYPGLIASLALNLLFVGVFAAAVWHHHQAGPKPKPIEPGLLGFVKELPDDRQDVVRAEITAAREAMKDLRATVRKSWVDANALLTAEPFDKAKFNAALAQLREVEDRYKTGLNGALADTAEKLSPDERKLLQSWREKRRPWLLTPRTEKSKDDGPPTN
jgi:uncharacterized membrane protein